MKFKHLLSLFILLIYYSANAQINTEIYRKINPDPGFTNTFYIGGDYESGNTNYTRFVFGYAADYYFYPMYLFTTSDISYKEGNNEIISNTGLIYIKAEFRINNILYPEIFFQRNFNKSKKIKDRNLFGGGARWHVLGLNPEEDSLNKFNIFLGAGVMSEYENYYQNIEDSRVLFRSTNYLNIRWKFKEQVELHSTTYFQFDFSNIDDYRILTEFSLIFTILDSFKFTLQLKDFYDNIPLPSTKANDLRIENRISFEF